MQPVDDGQVRVPPPDTGMLAQMRVVVRKLGMRVLNQLLIGVWPNRSRKGSAEQRQEAKNQ